VIILESYHCAYLQGHITIVSFTIFIYLQFNLKVYGYRIQQCTNHFVRTSMYYLWKEQYPKDNQIKLKMDISRTILELSFIVWFFKNKRERIASSQFL